MELIELVFWQKSVLFTCYHKNQEIIPQFLSTCRIRGFLPFMHSIQNHRNNTIDFLLFSKQDMTIADKSPIITIISGSSRDDNNSKKVALEYQRLLRLKEVESALLSLDELDVLHRNADFLEMENRFLIPASKFIIIMPEYNGSYPGILKLMIDNTDVAKAWAHKKVLLTGVSTGRAGNLRGMEHLTGSLLHMKMNVHHNRLPISQVNKLMNEQFQFADQATLQAIQAQLDDFLTF
jgi:NAD(P)H-dependent FMN reductase